MSVPNYSYQVDVLLEYGCVNSLFFVIDAITTTKVLLLYCLAKKINFKDSEGSSPLNLSIQNWSKEYQTVYKSLLFF